jgi:hypothetical protein
MPELVFTKADERLVEEVVLPKFDPELKLSALRDVLPADDWRWIVDECRQNMRADLYLALTAVAVAEKMAEYQLGGDSQGDAFPYPATEVMRVFRGGMCWVGDFKSPTDASFTRSSRIMEGLQAPHPSLARFYDDVPFEIIHQAVDFLLEGCRKIETPDDLEQAFEWGTSRERAKAPSTNRQCSREPPCTLEGALLVAQLLCGPLRVR